MKKTVFCLLLFSGIMLLSPQAQACTLLSPTALNSVFEALPGLQQRSQLPGRCDYSWARQDQAQIKQQNAAELKAGASGRYTPARLWQEVVLERYRVLNNESAAVLALNRLVKQGPALKFGSPDPLKNVAFKFMDETSAWSEKQSILLFTRGKALYRLHLRLGDFTPEELKAKAMALREAMTAS